jgi:hypothetical protein
LHESAARHTCRPDKKMPSFKSPTKQRHVDREMTLACIDHKSLEICDSMQAVAAEFSGCAVKFRCCFLNEEFNQFVWISVFQKRS